MSPHLLIQPMKIIVENEMLYGGKLYQKKWRYQSAETTTPFLSLVFCFPVLFFCDYIYITAAIDCTL